MKTLKINEKEQKILREALKNYLLMIQDYTGVIRIHAEDVVVILNLIKRLS